MSRPYRYPWPASAITPEEMALLYQARESGPRMPITRLIARAVRQTYGTATSSAIPRPIEDKKEAA
jgi:hypothetical protein